MEVLHRLRRGRWRQILFGAAYLLCVDEAKKRSQVVAAVPLKHADCSLAIA